MLLLQFSHDLVFLEISSVIKLGLQKQVENNSLFQYFHFFRIGFSHEFADIKSFLCPDRSNPGIIRRMNTRFAAQISLAIQQGDFQLAQDTYDNIFINIK
jgi:hypothetical protein